MDITSSRKHVLYNGIVSFFALVDVLNLEDLKDLKSSLEEADLAPDEDAGKRAVEGVVGYIDQLIEEYNQ